MGVIHTAYQVARPWFRYLLTGSLACGLMLAMTSAIGETVKGRIQNVSKKANTIQLSVKGQPPAVVRFGAQTVYQGAKDISELSPPDLIKVEYEPGQPASKITKVVFGIPAEQEIGINELLGILQGRQGAYTLGDARPAKKFGPGHVPSAISTPAKDPQALLRALPEDKGQLLVFYCGGPTCPFTGQAIKLAQEAGYTNLKGFQKGLPGWKKSKLPVHASRGWLSKNLDQHHVVIDVRNSATAEKDHLAGAVNLTTARLAAMTREFIDKQTLARLPGVTDVKAPIVLYADSHSAKDVLLAFKELRKWGYKNVSILEGGLKAWKTDGLPTASAALASEINYSKKLAKGAIPPEEFLVMVGKPGNSVFLDVRTEAETIKQGVLQGAKHIPLDELEARSGELSKDREILVYCENGIRAEMAYGTLGKLGYKTRFLNETPIFTPDGKVKF